MLDLLCGIATSILTSQKNLLKPSKEIYSLSGPRDNLILIFATQSNLEILAHSEHWQADRTFKSMPLIFGQLYTIHSLKAGNILSLVYALLPNKTE